MMGESACLMHAFAYASGTPNEAKEGNPIHALGESISFGRFTSESLSWEKWSSFSQNKYVEEAEKYSKPGSVAQKKAFFEAHYKRIAAQKAAAALLEQANHNPEPESEDIVHNVSPHNPQITNSNSQDNADEQHGGKIHNRIADPDVDATGYNSRIKDDKLEFCRVEGDDGHLAKVELSSQFGDVDNHNEDNELELSGKSEMEKPLLKEALELTNKKKPALRASKLPYSPANPKAAIVNHPRKKENNATPINRDVAIDYSDKKRFTSKPIQLSMNSTPTRELYKLTIPDTVNTKSSKVVVSYAKAYNCSTPLRTPAMTQASVAKHSSGTPQSENRRTRTPLHPSASGSKTIGPKWRFLAMDSFSKTLGACRNKSHSPVTSSPFSLRTEERAARRKEKLEEKFNEKVVQKVQLQTKLKDKAESELKRLRQSLCFKARPLPEFYRERNPPKNQVPKSPLKQLQSPFPRRKPNASTAPSTISLPSQWPASKPKHVMPNKNSCGQIHSHTSLADMIRRENTSPNIHFFISKNEECCNQI